MAITVKHTKVSTVPDTADTSLVRPSDWNADHTLTGLGTMAEQNANNVSITGGSISGTTVSGYIPTSEKAQPLGVATLDAGGKVPTSQIPLQGDLNYQGTWNASTNTPTLTSSTGTQGYYYVVDVAGSTNLNGITDWKVGDWAIFNGSVWQKVDNTDAVTSVNGQVGTVVLTTTNIAEGTNEYFTTARARASLSAGTGISYDSSTGVITNSSPSLGGDVVGPASATDNAITRFNTTTGKLIQNSTITLDDNGNIINANSIGFDTTPATVPSTVGTMSWDDGDGVTSTLLKGGNVTLQNGTQEYARVFNDSGATLTKGQVVYISGSQGNRVAVKLARANLEATSFGTLGLVAETITNGAEGFVIVSGALYKLNTTGLTAGSTVYLSPTTAGAITTTKPQAPDQLVVLGWVERVDNIVGSIYVKVDNGYELDELHDVRVTSPQSGNILIYDASTTPIGVWKNAFVTAGTGVSVTNGAGSVTIANTGVTQATAGTGISVSSGTGNVTITNTAPDQTVSISAGTGISTSGTYPNFTVTNTAPDQTVVLNAGTGISTSGTYPNFTITNTSPSSGGTVTSVGGTGTVNGITLSGTVTSSGNLTLGGTLSGVSLSTQVTGTLPIANGGTGATTRQDAMDALAGAVTSGQYLRGNGTDVVMSAIQAADVPTLNQNTTGTASNVTGTVAVANGGTGLTSLTANRVPYGNGTSALGNEAEFTYDPSLNTVTAPQVSASNGIFVNSATVTASYSIPSGSNAMSAGVITIANGITVTIPNGNNWIIV